MDTIQSSIVKVKLMENYGLDNDKKKINLELRTRSSLPSLF